MGKRMYYVFKIIQEAQGKSITGKEILKCLEKYDIYVDIKTVYSCIRNINDFFQDWLGHNMIASQRKSGFMIEHEFFTDGELQFLLDSIAFHQDLQFEDKNILRDRLLLLSSVHQQSRLIDFKPIQKELSFYKICSCSILAASAFQYSIIFLTILIHSSFAVFSS